MDAVKAICESDKLIPLAVAAKKIDPTTNLDVVDVLSWAMQNQKPVYCRIDRNKAFIARPELVRNLPDHDGYNLGTELLPDESIDQSSNTIYGDSIRWLVWCVGSEFTVKDTFIPIEARSFKLLPEEIKKIRKEFSKASNLSVILEITIPIPLWNEHETEILQVSNDTNLKITRLRNFYKFDHTKSHEYNKTRRQPKDGENFYDSCQEDADQSDPSYEMRVFSNYAYIGLDNLFIDHYESDAEKITTEPESHAKKRRDGAFWKEIIAACHLKYGIYPKNSKELRKWIEEMVKNNETEDFYYRDYRGEKQLGYEHSGAFMPLKDKNLRNAIYNYCPPKS